ncbi:hypothetical protein D6817_05555 [Candidatus Pacearchaeota archaeon]|nr:MAG: hypothetical protein D6817_05555 [Candidatus Pacearchaeota archaeon]
MDSMFNKDVKRFVAYRFRIGNIITGKPVFDADRLKFVEINGKEVMRVNVIGNVVEKFVQEGERKFGSLTLDDASGQIRVKVFGDDVEKIEKFEQGDTVVVIGLLRMWNNELYITPEIIKKRDPEFLLVRKYEVDLNEANWNNAAEIDGLRDKILVAVKESEKDGGIDIDKIILDLKEHPEVINREIKRLLEDGLIYEPRPGKLRYLG